MQIDILSKSNGQVKYPVLIQSLIAQVLFAINGKIKYIKLWKQVNLSITGKAHLLKGKQFNDKSVAKKKVYLNHLLFLFLIMSFSLSLSLSIIINMTTLN